MNIRAATLCFGIVAASCGGCANTDAQWQKWSDDQLADMKRRDDADLAREEKEWKLATNGGIYPGSLPPPVIVQPSYQPMFPPSYSATPDGFGGYDLTPK